MEHLETLVATSVVIGQLVADDTVILMGIEIELSWPNHHDQDWATEHCPYRWSLRSIPHYGSTICDAGELSSLIFHREPRPWPGTSLERIATLQQPSSCGSVTRKAERWGHDCPDLGI